MRKFLFMMATVFVSIMCSSCSSDEELDASTSNDADARVEAVKSFENKFNNEFSFLAVTRGSVTSAEGEASDSIVAQVGRELCSNLEVPTDELLASFGITDEMLLEEYKNDSSLIENSALEELKLFTALTIYDSFVSEAASPTTRGKSAFDIAGCITLGVSFKQLFDLPGKQIAKFAAKKLAGRLVPYVGWGWGVASAAYCISRL
jgi:hypothetical protein